MDFVQKKDKKILRPKVFFLFILFLFVSLSVVFALCIFQKPDVGKEGFILKIERGDVGRNVENRIEEENIFPHSFCVYPLMRILHIQAKEGSYRINKNETMLSFLKRFSKAEYGDVFVKLTFREGESIKDYAHILKEKGFIDDEASFISRYASLEGKLYPDTYSFLPNAPSEKIVGILLNNFKKAYEKAKDESALNISEDDAVKMASIIEKESGKSPQEKQMISAILWKRIAMGMPLQVDAPFLYERGKGSAQLSRKDLAKNSPYNTYTKKGLPPTAIGNPGYDAIYASLHPMKNPYLYYLHGKDGKVHFSKSYNEHLKNKRIYIQ